MPIFQESLNPFGKAFGDMSPSGRNNPYANSIMFNAMGNRLAEGRQLAAANNLSYGGVDDNGEHIFAPAGVYQPMQEAAEGILGLLDSRPLPPDMGLMQPEGPIIFPPIHGDPLPPEMLPIPPIDPNLEIMGGTLPNFDQIPLPEFYQEPIIDDPFQYGQSVTTIPDVRDPMVISPNDPVFERTPENFTFIEDPSFTQFEETPEFERTPLVRTFIEDPSFTGDVEGIDIPSPIPGTNPEVADEFIQGPVAVNEPISQPIDTGPNPFYVGATNVAQPPSMTPVAPSFSLDVGMGGYGTPTNTAGFNNYDFGNIGAGVYGGFNLPSTLTPPQTTTTPATGVAPQTTTTPLPTVNSFAGFNGFGGFGGF